jgi:aldehyde dehydrogenase (NAD+)
VEIFGPVLVSMTFRTPTEGVALANNTPYGLAASVWTENINLALDVARKLKAGTVWINSTNLFDAASGFGGYRESGFGREGGREGLYEYMKRRPPRERFVPTYSREGAGRPPEAGLPSIDRTLKLYIGGKQARPDSGYSRLVRRPDGGVAGEVGDGNRKDIRNAVEAAHAASKWSDTTGHARAQILYYMAENLAARFDEFVDRLVSGAGREAESAHEEVERSIEALFTSAAWADKYDGQVHSSPIRALTLAVREPIGVLGIVCPDELPLLGFVSLVSAAIAMGNTVIAVPSERFPLSVTDLYQVLDTSDVPAGVVNIVTGVKTVLASVLAGHEDVDGVWVFGDEESIRAVEAESAVNMKRTLARREGDAWTVIAPEAAEELLRQSTQVKNIWTPYGE